MGVREEEEEESMADKEEQKQEEVYESYVVGMLTNFSRLPLDRVHNMLKMFVSNGAYNMSIQQLQAPTPKPPNP